MSLPFGVRLHPLKRIEDHRGSLIEIYRDEWVTGARPCQWNATFSEANVLRGVHVHFKHDDYLVVLHGQISVGLYDARSGSPTFRGSCIVELVGGAMSALLIPSGVVHGFYCHEPSLYVYGMNSYYDPSDELGCHWADPALGIPWPCTAPRLSERDRAAVSLAELEKTLHALKPEFAKPAR